MTKRQQILRSLENEEYRREFAADVGTTLAIQVRLLREKYGWTQEELARRMGKRQETISQWENPDYGRYTLNTLKELASAYDVALLVRFAPFSDLVDWVADLTPQRLAPPSFAEELQSAVTGVTLPGDDSTEAQILGGTQGRLFAMATVDVFPKKPEDTLAIYDRDTAVAAAFAPVAPRERTLDVA